MMRDDLLARLAALPSNTDIGVRIGDAYVDIAELEPWGDGGFAALTCSSADIRDVLRECRVTPGEEALGRRELWL
ncbi:hypothetical protein AB0J80_33305 [Actinoplanes sp. NPDC049548]|uniref:hypothetical protein n=1 Tax=Actinoplanes sp. NPDC049548 TaxID=3155152 RepID=UPI003446B23A